jgi:hypothetical protein
MARRARHDAKRRKMVLYTLIINVLSPKNVLFSSFFRELVSTTFRRFASRRTRWADSRPLKQQFTNASYLPSVSTAHECNSPHATYLKSAGDPCGDARLEAARKISTRQKSTGWVGPQAGRERGTPMQPWKLLAKAPNHGGPEDATLENYWQSTGSHGRGSRRCD